MDHEANQAFREHYRANEIPRGYRGMGHLLFTFGGGTAALVACLLQLESVQPLEWLAVPMTLLYANLAEYLGHRWPMHRPFRGLKLIYRRHAGQHHRFFTHEHMRLDSLRDLRAVLFPPILVIFFFGGFGIPVGIALNFGFSPNVAWLFVASAIAYFLNYEFLHLAYHLHPESFLGRRRLIRRLRGLHTLHHDPALMTRWNFNISYPICDLLFGTFKRQQRSQLASDGSARP